MSDSSSIPVGIDALNVYPGRAVLDVNRLAQARGLDTQRFQNLLLHQKTVALPGEDPVSFAVNAAQPVLNRLTPGERERIELLIVATESGLDFGKAMSTYVHHYLQLNRRCRNFEVKHACYGGTAALQMAVAWVRGAAPADARALVITTDVARPIPHTYAEPSQGAAAVAMLVSRHPRLLTLEAGANGYYGYEVMDSCRPTAEIETGDADLSLLTYLDCIEHSFQHYCEQVGPVDFQEYFDYLAFHTPFGGMAKGAHRTLLRKLKRLPPPAIEEDFRRRLEPSLTFCQEVGNIYSGSLYLALAGLLERGVFDTPRRIGLFSYGSGCCSEFFSGLADREAQSLARSFGLPTRLAERYALSMAEYEDLIVLNRSALFGVQDAVMDERRFAEVYHSHFAGRGLLMLDQIVNFQRQYRWS
jgi:polyketide biosynthesis 3-hydroxy-3-methylglutaryl-CoA synthase-like enzyme PksG